MDHLSWQFSNSSQQLITCSVLQGSIFGPLLFILYIIDIANCNEYLKFILVADDTNLMYSNSNFDRLITVVNANLKFLLTGLRRVGYF